MREFRDAVGKRLAGLKLSPEREAEVTEELAAHLEDRHRELMASRIGSEEALVVVLEDLGREDKLGKELRTTEKRIEPDRVVLGARRIGFWRDLLQDVNYGLRMIRRNPGVTAIAVITIALGIGANTAIFSVLNAVILRPLGGPHPERLMMIWESRPREGVHNNAVSPGTIVIRTQTNPSALVPAIRAQVRQLEPDLALSDVRTMEEVMAQSVSAPRFYLILLSVFGIVAVILAAAGVYGVISYTVAQGTRDIGVRIALGANLADVLRAVLGQGIFLTIVSLVIGLAASIALTRLMGSPLFGVKATDPMTLAVMVILTTAIALLACYFPERRAARIDPLVALRHQ